MPPTTTDRRRQATLLTQAIYVGPANAELVIGQPWRWVRDTARRLGVEILRVGSKPMIRAAELAAALERDATATRPEPELDVRAEILRALGGR